MGYMETQGSNEMGLSPPSPIKVDGGPKYKFRLEINKYMLMIQWNPEVWKKLEDLYKKQGLTRSSRYHLFGSEQSSDRDVYLYPRGSTPRPRHLTLGDLDIEIIDNIDDHRIIVFRDRNYVTINLAIFRVIPNSDYITVIEFDANNIFIPNIKSNTTTLITALKTAFTELLKDINKIRYKITIEAY